MLFFFFFQAEDGIRDYKVTGVQTCALPICLHDVQAVVGQSPSVVLQIPGADPSAPVDRAQAIELLRRHLRAGAERGLRVSAVREVEPGRGYAELDRRYVVAGTSDERRETIFLGFRKPGPEWRLAELRSAP